MVICKAPICCRSPCWHSYMSSRLSYWSAFWILKERKPDSRDVIFLFILFSGREHLLSSSISIDLKKLKFYFSPFHPKHFLFHPYCPLIPVSAVSPVSTITVIKFTWWLFHSFCFSSYLVSLHLGEGKAFLYEERVSLKPLVTTTLCYVIYLSGVVIEKKAKKPHPSYKTPQQASSCCCSFPHSSQERRNASAALLGRDVIAHVPSFALT